MPAPRLEGVDAIEEDLSAVESNWALYKEYSEELKVDVQFDHCRARKMSERLFVR